MAPNRRGRKQRWERADRDGYRVSNAAHFRQDRTGSGARARSSAREIYAAIDLGTNNCRLLVARPAADGGFRVIDAFSRIVRLGEGLGRAGVVEFVPKEDPMVQRLLQMREDIFPNYSLENFLIELKGYALVERIESVNGRQLIWYRAA